MHADRFAVSAKALPTQKFRLGKSRCGQCTSGRWAGFSLPTYPFILKWTFAFHLRQAAKHALRSGAIEEMWSVEEQLMTGNNIFQ
jgi:hypothetical protein